MSDILLPNVFTSIRHGPKYREWCVQELADGSNLDDAIYFFEKGLTPWFESHGYDWACENAKMIKLFTHFVYAIVDTELQNKVSGRKFHLSLPAPVHRNLPEDRETFDHLVGLVSFSELLDEWRDEYPILQNSFSHLLYEFCYIYAKVNTGPPGRMTERALGENMDSDEEESGKGTSNANLPDAYAGRRKNDLY